MARPKSQTLEKTEDVAVEASSEVSKETLEALKKEIEEKLRKEFEEKNKIEQEKIKSQAIQQVDHHKLVPVMSLSTNTLFYKSPKTGLTITWEDIGSTELIEVSELITMRNSSRAFLEKPYLLVLDDEVVDNVLRLRQLYDKVPELEQLESFFNLDTDKMEEFINSVPSGIIEQICLLAKKKVLDGSLDSKKRIDYLESKFNIDLQVLK